MSVTLACKIAAMVRDFTYTILVEETALCGQDAASVAASTAEGLTSRLSSVEDSEVWMPASN